MNTRSFLSVWRPWMLFFSIGRPFSGIACALLQATGIGWPFSVMWASNALEGFEAKQKAEKSFSSGSNEYSTTTEAHAKDNSSLETATPVKRTLAGKATFAFLGIIIAFALSMAIATYKPDLSSVTENSGEKISGEQYMEILGPGGGAPGSIDEKYVSFDSGTDEWTVRIKGSIRVVNVETTSSHAKIPFRLLPGAKPGTAKVMFPDFGSGGQYKRYVTLIVKDVLPPWYVSAKQSIDILNKMHGTKYEPNPNNFFRDGGYMVNFELPKISSFQSFWGKFNKSRHEK